MSPERPRPPQFWLRCETHDVRYLNRSAESQRHGSPCNVVRDDLSPVEREVTTRYQQKLRGESS